MRNWKEEVLPMVEEELSRCESGTDRFKGLVWFRDSINGAMLGSARSHTANILRGIGFSSAEEICEAHLEILYREYYGEE